MEGKAPSPRAGGPGAEIPGGSQGVVIEFFSLFQLARWATTDAVRMEASRLQDAARSARTAREYAGIAAEVKPFGGHQAAVK